MSELIGLVSGAALCYLFLWLLSNRKIRNPIRPTIRPSKPAITGYLGGPGRVCRHCGKECEKILVTADGIFGCQKCYES